MRNPIFGADTVFLDRDSTGALHYVSADETKSLSGGTRLIRLETKQSLASLTMESGAKLMLSPESVFALAKDAAGNVLRYMPVDAAAANYAHLIGWDRYPDNYDLLRFRISGMVSAAGLHSLERHRVSNVVVPASVAPDLIFFLESYLRDAQKRGEIGQTHGVKWSNIEGRVFIKSRALTSIVGLLLRDKTQAVCFHPDDLKREEMWAFLHGLLSTSPREGNDIVFRNRDSECVRMVHDMLWRFFGVTSTLSIHPLESRITASSRTQLPHTLRLSAEDRARARLAGLDPTWAGTEVPFTVPDTIKHIEVVEGRQPAVIVMPGQTARKFPLAANTFQFEPQFQLQAEFVDLASHPTLLDSSDPTTFAESRC